MPQCLYPTRARLEDLFIFFTILLNGQGSQSAKQSISQLIEPEIEPPISLAPTNSRSLRLPAAGLMQIEQDVNVLIGGEANQGIWSIQAETMLKRIYTPDFLCFINRQPVES